jgi:hypothetical protein
MATANIKITALSDITSANMTFNDLVAVVDMNGTPETKKATIQLVGNLILNGAGGSYFPAAAQAVLAQSVTNAAQPNITSVGTLSSLAVTANVSAGNLSASGTINGVLVGEGGNISNVQVGNVAGLGNIATINLDGNVSNVFRGDGTFGPEGAGGNANYANFAGTAFAVAGANVSGEVGFAAVANSVALANVSSAGNIASINLDGNVSNVLRGDGTWDSDANSTYGDGNVVSLLAAFGSNTISTTGLITGDGGGLSNLAVANVTGLGNIATTNLDGNSANYLDGSGSWGPLSITLSGDGGNISNIQGANVSGEVSFAATANAVTLANVSGAGNIASINLDGNVSNVLRGDGTFAADSEGTYGDSNVVSLLGAFGSNTISTTGNVSVGTLTGSNGAAFISTADNQFVVERDNGTSFRFKGNNIDGNTVQTYAGIFYNPVYGNTPETQTRLLIGSNEDVSIEIQTSNEMRISAVDDNTGGGKVRIASGDGNGSPYAIEFHPGTLAEVDNLVVEINTGGLEVTGNLSATGNISAVNLGNVSAVNLDGNVANVLAGDGTFTALPVINANTLVWTTAPTANNDPGTAGEIAYDAGGNLYVCVSTNTWSKFSGTTSW